MCILTKSDCAGCEQCQKKQEISPSAISKVLCKTKKAPGGNFGGEGPGEDSHGDILLVNGNQAGS